MAPQKIKDHRYTVINIQIVSGAIFCFQQIFEFIPPTTFYRDMGWGRNRLNTIYKQPADMKVNEMVKFGNLVGLSPDYITEFLLRKPKRDPGSLWKKDVEDQAGKKKKAILPKTKKKIVPPKKKRKTYAPKKRIN